MNKYSLTEHSGTTFFSNTVALQEYIESRYCRTYVLRKKTNVGIEVVSNSAVVGVIKKHKNRNSNHE